MEGFMTVKEAAELKHLSTGHIRQLCIDNKLKGAHKMGNQWIIPEKTIREYEPDPKGFAVVWERRRRAQNYDLIQRALAENAARVQAK